LTARNIKESIKRHLSELEKICIEELVELRYEKYRKIGIFREGD